MLDYDETHISVDDLPMGACRSCGAMDCYADETLCPVCEHLEASLPDDDVEAAYAQAAAYVESQDAQARIIAILRRMGDALVARRMDAALAGECTPRDWLDEAALEEYVRTAWAA